MKKTNIAWVILIDGRYYYGKGKRDRILTAHCLAGARLFAAWESAAAIEIADQANAKGRHARLALVGQMFSDEAQI